MGISHYWQRGTELPADAFALAVVDVRKVLATLDLKLAGIAGSGEVVLRADAIVFNGAQPATVEPFEIHPTEFDRRGRKTFWASCKTGGQPYDLAVKATLIVLKHHLGDRIVVASDTKDDAWSDARQMCRSAVGYGDDFRLDTDADTALDESP